MVEVKHDTAIEADGATTQQHGNGNGHRHDSDSQVETTPKGTSASKKSKKRRKVNHACVYCRRSHMTCDQGRPCSRCIKRSIGHLCHDEPREAAKKPAEAGEEFPGIPIESSQSKSGFSTTNVNISMAPEPEMESVAEQSQTGFVPSMNDTLFPHNNGVLQYFDWGGDSANQYSDIHAHHPSFSFNTSEMSNEYHLLNQFLSSTLNDETLPSKAMEDPFAGESTVRGSVTDLEGGAIAPAQSSANPRPANDKDTPSNAKKQRAKDHYYLVAADPAGTDTSEQRMSKLLSAKYDAGLLKPFDAIRGYARLNQYLERHAKPSTRQSISRSMDRFRPGFREKVAKLTDFELVKAEMWFERKLMDYDRVFASMAVPACCWRRTGEIFRGNQAMAELIEVPVDRLRDGKVAMHEIVTEDSLVIYWEKFAGIAFEKSKKAILTSCSLRKVGSKPTEGKIKCCFSFTVQRDDYEVPGLIIGNFLPILPANGTL